MGNENERPHYDSPEELKENRVRVLSTLDPEERQLAEKIFSLDRALVQLESSRSRNDVLESAVFEAFAKAKTTFEHLKAKFEGKPSPEDRINTEFYKPSVKDLVVWGDLLAKIERQISTYQESFFGGRAVVLEGSLDLTNINYKLEISKDVIAYCRAQGIALFTQGGNVGLEGLDTSGFKDLQNSPAIAVANVEMCKIFVEHGRLVILSWEQRGGKFGADHRLIEERVEIKGKVIKKFTTRNLNEAQSNIIWGGHIR